MGGDDGADGERLVGNMQKYDWGEGLGKIREKSNTERGRYIEVERERVQKERQNQKERENQKLEVE